MSHLSPKQVLLLYRTTLRYASAAAGYNPYKSRDLRKLYRRQFDKYMHLALSRDAASPMNAATWHELRIRAQNTLNFLSYAAHYSGTCHSVVRNMASSVFTYDVPPHMSNKHRQINPVKSPNTTKYQQYLVKEQTTFAAQETLLMAQGANRLILSTLIPPPKKLPAK